MKKGKGFFGFAKEMVIFFILAGLLVAFLALHDWDIVQAIHWLLSKCWEIIDRIANFFMGNKGFQQVAT